MSNIPKTKLEAINQQIANFDKKDKPKPKPKPKISSKK